MLEAGIPENDPEIAARERERLFLAAVGKRLVGPAVHEVLGALTSIHGFAEFLLNHQVDVTQQRELLGTIHLQSEQLQSLVEELVCLFQMESMTARELKLSLQSLAPLLNDAVAACKSADSELRLELQIADALPPLLIDAPLMQQAIAQLLSNCVRRPAQQQSIRITLRQSRKPGFIELEVQDRRASLKADHPDRMFEPFYRANKGDFRSSPPYGLAAAKRIAELHGGSLKCQASSKAGLTVLLRLPIRH